MPTIKKRKKKKDDKELCELIVAIQNGNEEAFSRLFNLYYNDVFKIAMANVHDYDKACDLTQETFIEVFNTIKALNEPESFHAWVNKITYHRCTNYFRSKQYKHEVLLDESEKINLFFESMEEDRSAFIPEASLDAKELVRIVRSFIKELPAEQRDAVIMYYFNETPLYEIADIQRSPVDTIKSRLYYARKSLKKTIEEYENKHKIKLHGIPFIPVPLDVLLDMDVELTSEAVSMIAEGISSAIGVNITVATVEGGIITAIVSAPVVVKVVAAVVATVMISSPVIVGRIRKEHTNNQTIYRPKQTDVEITPTNENGTEYSPDTINTDLSETNTGATQSEFVSEITEYSPDTTNTDLLESNTGAAQSESVSEITDNESVTDNTDPPVPESQTQVVEETGKVELDLPLVNTQDSSSNESSVEESINETTATPAGYFEYTVNADGKSITLTSFITSNNPSTIIIPDTIDGYAVTAIGAQAFDQKFSNLAKVVVPEGVTSIGKWAFDKIEEIWIPNTVSYIDQLAFYWGEKYLKSIHISEDNPYYYDIDGVLFDSSGKLTIFPMGNNTTEYVIPDGTTAIGDRALFTESHFQHITIPASVKSIGDRAIGSADEMLAIYYKGTYEEWQKISVGKDNDVLEYTNIIFLATNTMITQQAFTLNLYVWEDRYVNYNEDGTVSSYGTDVYVQYSISGNPGNLSSFEAILSYNSKAISLESVEWEGLSHLSPSISNTDGTCTLSASGPSTYGSSNGDLARLMFNIVDGTEEYNFQITATATNIYDKTYTIYSTIEYES